MNEQKRFRCAVYTRKSSEEGLDQDFNSLEAQREAGEAYIRSQAHEGWKLLPERFDDGGFSGGNMDRPALVKLMTMIRDGQIDIIVIYKIDRLTRSLTDFARLAETFDKHGVSFVSVTQQFNTTTSMGRLMLNVLLSFAQFEREITGERIRDKIAASKKKGMWMGGPTPMGYDVKDRQLVINPGDAEIIRSIFQLYLEEGSVPALLDCLERDGIRTVERLSVKGNLTGGRSFTRGHLYKLLSNPIYIGRIPHKRASHPGMHEAIVDRSTWDKVQSQLADNTQGPRTRRRRAERRGHLLAGILVSERGNRFIPSHANKGARQYRYYVEEMAAAPGEAPHTLAPPIRLPAREIEAAAILGLKGVLGDGRWLLQNLGEVAPQETQVALAAADRLTATLNAPHAHATTKLLKAIVRCVVYRTDRLLLKLSSKGLRQALGIGPFGSDDAWPANGTQDDNNIETTIPLSTRRRGPQMKLLIGTASAPATEANRALMLAIARARDWADRLISGEVRTITEIAQSEGVTDGYVGQILPLAFLAPELIERILSSDPTVLVTASQVIVGRRVPERWKGQLAACGQPHPA
jgi:site-specific DNA recombinase